MPAYCELPALGLIGYTGAEAGAFLHNQLTCDVSALTPGHSVYGSYCTPKGRVLATFLLWRIGDDYCMQLPSSLRAAIQKRLTMYVLRSKVRIEDAGPRWRTAGLFGEDAAELLRKVLGAAPRNEHEVAVTANSICIRLPGDRYEILLAQDSAPAMLAMLKDGAEPASPAHWEWLDIRAGVPVILPPTQEQFVPQMVNLDLIGGLSFTKGCYPGQEIVARTHFLGKLKQRMYLAHLASGEPQAGDKLYSAVLGEQSSGLIVNAAPAPQGGFDALAAMQIAAATGGPVHWNSPDGPELQLLPLPYPVTIEG